MFTRAKVVAKNVFRPLLVMLLYALGVLVLVKAGVASVIATAVGDGAIIVWWLVRGRALLQKDTQARQMDTHECVSMAVVFFAVWLFGQIAATWVLEQQGAGGAFSTYQEKLNEIPFAAVALTLVLAPISEEILIRGVVFSSWRVSLGPWWALWGQALLFAVLHGTVVHLVPTFVLGVFCAVVVSRMHTLRWSITAHIAYNVLTLYFKYFELPALAFEPVVFASALVACLVILCGIYQTGFKKGDDVLCLKSASEH